MLFSVVIATHNRKTFLVECLTSIQSQTFSDYEVIIAHSGADDGTKEVCELWEEKISVHYFPCPEKGAAVQRNYGVQNSSGEWVVFIDDDVVLDKWFLEEFKKAIDLYPHAGGISARITNQFFEPISRLKRILLWISGIPFSKYLPGKVAGPALHFLPEKEGPQFEYLDWMPGVCTYPKPLFLEFGGFPSWFRDYSFAEDLYFSSKVKQKLPLILNRHATLYHNDQGGKSHQNWTKLSFMQMINRLYIIKHTLPGTLYFPRLRLYLWYTLNSLIEFLKGKKKISVLFSEFTGYTKGLFSSIN